MDTESALQVIEGCLLSDACLSRCRGCNARFQMDLSGEEHIDWLLIVKQALNSLDIQVSDICPKVSKRVTKSGREYIEASLWSSSDERLTKMHSLWYEGRTKVLPADFTLTNVSLTHWFIGDGTSFQMSGRSNLVRVKFATDGFNTDECDVLSIMLKDMGIFAERYPSSKTLYVNDAASVVELMSLVSSVLPPSYKYKEKWPKMKEEMRGPKND